MAKSFVRRFWPLLVGVPLLACLALGVVIICTSGYPVIEVRNDSAQTLERVQLSGGSSSWTRELGDLRPGEVQQVSVSGMRGDSGLVLAFVADGQRQVHEGLGYLESSGGYTAHLVVDEALRVECAIEIMDFNWQRLVASEGE